MLIRQTEASLYLLLSITVRDLDCIPRCHKYGSEKLVYALPNRFISQFSDRLSDHL